MKPQPDIRIRITGEKFFFGPGAHQLLTLIDETSSLSGACRKMGISYTKGRTIIYRIEQQFGYPVVNSSTGGRHGGYSVVTENGKELMRRYTVFCNEVKEHAKNAFDRHFDDFEWCHIKQCSK